MAGRSSSGGPSLWLWLGLALLVVVLDQLSKTLILGSFQLNDSRTITSWFNLVRVHNTGAAFSFLAGAGGWQRWFFTAIAVAASVLLVWMLRKGGSRLLSLGLTLILGGALGNLWDRVTLGRVTDFLLFHYAGWSWPAFNIADSAITVGAACIILDSFRSRRDEAPAQVH
jgi:signal peptidase II